MSSLLNTPYHITPEFLAKKAASWQTYAESVARISGHNVAHIGMPREKGFTAGYDKGYYHGVMRTLASQTDTALARKTDPASAQQAAARATRQAGKLKDLVIQHLREADLTASEIAQRIGVPRDSISPRIAPLVRTGRIHVVAGKGKQAVYRLGKGIVAA